MGQNWLWAKTINQCQPGCNGHSDSCSSIEFHVKNITFHNFSHFPFAPRYFAFGAIRLSKEEALIAEDVHGQARV